MNLETWFLTKLEQRLAMERLIAVGSPDTISAGLITSRVLQCEEAFSNGSIDLMSVEPTLPQLGLKKEGYY